MRAVDRFLRYIRQRNINQQQAESLIKVGKGYLSKQLKSQSGDLGTEVLQNIINVFPEIDIFWLMKGEATTSNVNVHTGIVNQHSNVGDINFYDFAGEIRRLNEQLKFKDKHIELQNQQIEFLSHQLNDYRDRLKKYECTENP